jgi:hypothetical protein
MFFSGRPADTSKEGLGMGTSLCGGVPIGTKYKLAEEQFSGRDMQSRNGIR